MPLSFNEPRITDQLSQAIKEMRDFLLNNPSDEEYYKMLYDKINKLTLKAKTEGWFGYEHKNPHKILIDFLNSNNVSELVLKHYSIPIWSRKLVKQSKPEKTKRILEWIFNQISKFKPDIKI